MEVVDYLHEPNTEPIPGYHLISPLGRGGFGEVWKCEAPGGLLKAIKFVHGNAHALDQCAPASEELAAIQRIKAIRHPFILSIERVEVDRASGELVIVCELADRSLADVLAEERNAGKTGIARDTVLSYLREAAEALDVMHVRHGLQHLDVKPQNLFLVSNHVKVGDFGLVQSCSAIESRNISLSAITPIYAAPEVFQNRISQHADQYSLAIVYHELLTGLLPFDGRNSRQLMLQHIQSTPSLQALPEKDRPIIGRALSKDPADRFANCSDLIAALISGHCETTATVIELLPQAAPKTDDTRVNPPAKTIRTRSPKVRPPSAPSDVQGVFTIDELVSRSPQAEVWSAFDGEGRPLLIKVLFAFGHRDQGNVARLEELRHPLLMPTSVVRNSPGRLVLSMSAGGQTVREVCAQEPGLSRDQLLACLRDVAETLDTFAATELYHLGLNPRALIFDETRLKILDFGIAQLVWKPTAQMLAPLNVRYNAPELKKARSDTPITSLARCDQYSLALIYHELLTGQLPALRDGETRSVERLPEEDRAAVARALHPDPEQRWESILAFVAALEGQGGGERTESGTEPVADSREIPLIQSGEELRVRLGANLSADAISERLRNFQQQWGAKLIGESKRNSVTYQMPTPPGIGVAQTDQSARFELALQIEPPEIMAPEGVQVQTVINVTIRACDENQEARQCLTRVAPILVDSVRQHLKTGWRGRRQERVAWPYPLQLCSILPDGRRGPTIECQGKDISPNGIGFYLSGQLPSSHVLLHMPQTPQTTKADMPARVVRVQGCGNGWFEVGAVLLPPDELPEDDE